MSGRTALQMMEDLRLAMLDGNLAVLDGLPDELQQAVPGLAALSREELVQLRQAAGENMRRIEAALSGLRSARRRIADIAGADRSLTYDKRGTKNHLATTENGRRV